MDLEITGQRTSNTHLHDAHNFTSHITRNTYPLTKLNTRTAYSLEVRKKKQKLKQEERSQRFCVLSFKLHLCFFSPKPQTPNPQPQNHRRALRRPTPNPLPLFVQAPPRHWHTPTASHSQTLVRSWGTVRSFSEFVREAHCHRVPLPKSPSSTATSSDTATVPLTPPLSRLFSAL